MPWLSVNQTRERSDSAVPTPLLALDVQRGGMPGWPGAGFMNGMARPPVCPPLRRPLQHGRPPHVTAVRCVVERDAAMHGAAVVPDDDVADPPFVAVQELRLRRKIHQLAQQGATLVYRPADDLGAVRGEVEVLAPRPRMHLHEAVPRRWLRSQLLGAGIGI